MRITHFAFNFRLGCQCRYRVNNHDIDSARRKRRAKHGGGQERLDVDDLEIAAGADDVVRKPVHVREIVARVGAINRRLQVHEDAAPGSTTIIPIWPWARWIVHSKR